MSRFQINLLPDIKQEFEKARRTRNLVLSTAILITIASVALFIVVFTAVDVVQKQQLGSANTSLNKANTQLKAIPDLAKITTVQNQLQTLVSLHQGKYITSRIFNYLPQVTPSNASIGKLDVDLAATTMIISGNADSQATVNSFIDTLKLTTYKVGTNDSDHKAFPSVVESSFTINQSNVSYALDIQFDAKLFANNLLDSQGKAQIPKLTVPKVTNTQSGDSSNLFQAQTGETRQ
jgi:Tfp pilus assembly protein PilN